MLEQWHDEPVGDDIDRVQCHGFVVDIIHTAFVEVANGGDHAVTVALPDIIGSVFILLVRKQLAGDTADRHTAGELLAHLVDQVDVLECVETVSFRCAQWFYQSIAAFPCPYRDRLTPVISDAVLIGYCCIGLRSIGY